MKLESKDDIIRIFNEMKQDIATLTEQVKTQQMEQPKEPTEPTEPKEPTEPTEPPKEEIDEISELLKTK